MRKINGKWIFKYREFEYFHGAKYMLSREERGKAVPAFYAIPRCCSSVRFIRKYELGAASDFTVRSEGSCCVSIDGERQNGAVSYTFPEGRHTLMIAVGCASGMCALKIDGDAVFTDESWSADSYDGCYEPVGISPLMDGQSCLPGEYSFPREAAVPVSDVISNGERIVDFGRESFIGLELEGLKRTSDVFYGESLGETYSSRCVITDRAEPGRSRLRERACRYIRFTGGLDFRLNAFYRHPERNDISEFNCADSRLKDIYAVSKYTLDLCSQMFLLDGIKRDRWPWAGDAYITAKMNYCSFFDADIVKRTLILMRGEPQTTVVNGILEYTFYWFLALRDYLAYTGDTDFICRNYDYAKRLIEAYIDRCDSNGLLPNFGAWLFIDWHDIEKSGYNCCVQMLFGSALACMSELAEVCGRKSDASKYTRLHDELYGKVNSIYWNPEKHAYISAYDGAKPSKQVRRHQNYLAILLGYAGSERRNEIIESVLENGTVPKLTTPFFKFFEYDILCRCGKIKEAFALMKAYYGGMLDLGATSVWEEFDPDMRGEEHYAMYGEPYDKSLCHAWGAGPLYFIGSYVAGVKPVGNGFTRFEVKPSAQIGDFSAVVPVKGGSVSVKLEGSKLTVLAGKAGGILTADGRVYVLEAGKPVVISNFIGR